MKGNQEPDGLEVELINSSEELQDMRKINGFYDRMRKKITQWVEKQGSKAGNQVTEVLLLAPDFFMLLVRLMLDKRVAAKSKAMVIGGLSYYLLPFDFLPELFLGPLGFSDDLVLAVLIINNLLQTDQEVIFSHWSGKEDLLMKIGTVMKYAEKFLNQNVYVKIKKYLGKLK